MWELGVERKQLRGVSEVFLQEAVSESDLILDVGKRRQGGPFRQQDVVARKSMWGSLQPPYG